MTLKDRQFFEHFERLAQSDTAEVVRVYCCPCCGYPTLGEPPSYGICPICSWQDDGCDGGGPNACGLAATRENSAEYLTSFSPCLRSQFYQGSRQNNRRKTNLARG